jgi:hypothetical protein
MALDDNSTDVAPMDRNESLGDREAFHDAFQERLRGCHTQRKFNVSKSLVRILASRINKSPTLPVNRSVKRPVAVRTMLPIDCSFVWFDSIAVPCVITLSVRCIDVINLNFNLVDISPPFLFT